MLGINLNGVNAAGGSTMIEPGGYVIEITRVKNDTANFRLEIEFDIAEGPYTGYYKDEADRSWWKGKVYKQYGKTKNGKDARPFFKKFIETIEDSNGGAPGLVVQVTDEDGEPQEDIDETKLVGMKLGIVFGLEEKVSKKSGNIYKKEDFFNAEFVTVDDIHEGKFTVPELKKLENVPTASSSTDVVDTTAGFTPIKDEDVPF